MAKIIFMDIDGTLVEHAITHTVPDSAFLAVTKARENGHKIIICTGRVKSAVNKEMLRGEYDGYIYAAGGHVELNQEKLFYQRISPENVQEIIDVFHNAGIGLSLEGEFNTYLDEISHNRFMTLFQERNQLNSEMARFKMQENNFKSFDDFDLVNHPINKVSFFAQSYEAIQQVKNTLEHKYHFIIQGINAMNLINGEIVPNGISKASGMDVILKAFGESIENTIAYGDSLNDVEMIEHAKIGICMGNGHDELKQLADEVIDEAHHDAIYKSFKQHKLI